VLTLGICASCGFAYPIGAEAMLHDHFADPTTKLLGGPLCAGSSRPPAWHVRPEAQGRHNVAWRPLSAVRTEAAVVLDAVLEQRDVEQLFPGRLPALLKLALVGYRLRWPKSRVERPLRWRDRPTGRTTSLSKRVDAYCLYCAELLESNVKRSERNGHPTYSLLVRHTTTCALQCLAGLRQYARPDARYLPRDAP
jgi:hypothetical protein